MKISVGADSRLIISEYAANKKLVPELPELKVTRYNKLIGFFLEKMGYAVALSVDNQTFYANKLSIGREYLQKVKQSKFLSDKMKQIGYNEFLDFSGLSKDKIEEKKREKAFVDAVNQQGRPNVDYYRLAKDLNEVLFRGNREETLQVLAILRKNFEAFPSDLQLPQGKTISKQLDDLTEKLKNQEADEGFSSELWDFSRQLLEITKNTEYDSWHS